MHNRMLKENLESAAGFLGNAYDSLRSVAFMSTDPVKE